MISTTLLIRWGRIFANRIIAGFLIFTIMLYLNKRFAIQVYFN